MHIVTGYTLDAMVKGFEVTMKIVRLVLLFVLWLGVLYRVLIFARRL